MLSEPATRVSTMDVQEFQTFYQEKFTLIYRYVYSQVGKREETEDLTSEIFLKAVSGIKYEHSPQSRHRWLYLIARTTIADYWRAHYRLPMSSLDELLEDGWEGPGEEEPTASSSLPAERVQRLLQALPEQKHESSRILTDELGKRGKRGRNKGCHHTTDEVTSLCKGKAKKERLSPHLCSPPL